MINLNRLTISIPIAAFSLAAVFVLVKKIFSIYRHWSNQTVEKTEKIKFIIFKNEKLPFTVVSNPQILYQSKIHILSSSGQTLAKNGTPDFTAGLIKSASQIDIIIKSDDEEINVVLSLKLKEKFLTFLTCPFPHQDYCCSDFISQLFDKYKPEATSSFYLDEWDLSQEAPSIGSAIMLYSVLETSYVASVKAQHFALCLQEDLFLSLLGVRGALVVTDLETLKIAYDDPKVQTLIPKQL